MSTISANATRQFTENEKALFFDEVYTGELLHQPVKIICVNPNAKHIFELKGLIDDIFYKTIDLSFDDQFEKIVWDKKCPFCMSKFSKIQIIQGDQEDCLIEKIQRYKNSQQYKNEIEEDEENFRQTYRDNIPQIAKDAPSKKSFYDNNKDEILRIAKSQGGIITKADLLGIANPVGQNNSINESQQPRSEEDDPSLGCSLEGYFQKAFDLVCGFFQKIHAIFLDFLEFFLD